MIGSFFVTSRVARMRVTLSTRLRHWKIYQYITIKSLPPGKPAVFEILGKTVTSFSSNFLPTEAFFGPFAQQEYSLLLTERYFSFLGKKKRSFHSSAVI